MVAGRPRRGAFDPAVTLGPDLDIGALLLRCVLAVLAGLALSVLFGLLARSRRPPPAPVPPPHSSAPLAPWQAPRTGSTAHRRRGR